MWDKVLPYIPFRALQNVTRSEIVELVPFDVKIGLTENTGIDTFALTDIVEEWLGNSFSNNDLGDKYARFTTVIIDNQDTRFLQQATTSISAAYNGVSVWTRTGDLLVPDENVVTLLQTQAFVNDEALLLQALQKADASSGLGEYVTNVRASISSNSKNNNTSSTSNSLDAIIIVAIVIAALAFFLLGFALFMAWRHNRSFSAGEMTLKNTMSPEGTGDESEFEMSAKSNKRASAAANAATSPPKEIERSPNAGLYPESVISDDISTSLTAYYQSGMGRNSGRGGGGGVMNNTLNDAASVSSMESYGYSLDGYTNSIAPTNPNDEPY